MHHANVEKTAIRCLYGNSLLKNYAATVNVVYNSELLLNQQYVKLLKWLYRQLFSITELGKRTMLCNE